MPYTESILYFLLYKQWHGCRCSSHHLFELGLHKIGRVLFLQVLVVVRRHLLNIANLAVNSNESGDGRVKHVAHVESLLE